MSDNTFSAEPEYQDGVVPSTSAVIDNFLPTEVTLDSNPENESQSESQNSILQTESMEVDIEENDSEHMPDEGIAPEKLVGQGENFDPSEYVEPELEEDAEESAFVARENKYKKGTIEWIQEEQSIVSEHLAHVQEDFDKFQRILKFENALVNSNRSMLAERTEELTALLGAQESLSSWIGERQNTYAWQLLEALHAQRQKVLDFESGVKSWCENPVDDLYETSIKHQKRFKRRLKIGFGGIILALTIGTITNFVLDYFHIHWIFKILAFVATLLGIGNPFASVPVIIGGLSVFTWLAALTSHFRSYVKFRRQLEKQVAEARYYLRAVKEIGSQKAKIASLHAQVQDYLEFMAEVLQKPWVINEKWLDYETTAIDSSKLPTSLVIAKPLESGIYQEVTKKVIEEFTSTNWRSRQFEILVREAEKLYLVGANTLEPRINSDSAIREKMKTDLESTELLDSVGSALVEDLANQLRNKFLPNQLGFHVGSVKPDALGSLDLSSSVFGSSEEDANWHTFVTSILGQASGWSNLAFSVSGLESRLAGSDSMKSFALIPERLREDVLAPIEAVPLRKNENSGVEVVVRVDVTSWLDPEKVNLLINEPESKTAITTASPELHRPDVVVRG